METFVVIVLLLFFLMAIVAFANAWEHQRHARRTGAPVASLWCHLRQSWREELARHAARASTCDPVVPAILPGTVATDANPDASASLGSPSIRESASTKKSDPLVVEIDFLSQPKEAPRASAETSAPIASAQTPHQIGTKYRLPAKKRRAQRPASDEVEFCYSDEAGNVSLRRVSVQSVDGRYLNGFCHTRQAIRTFMIRRILGDVISMQTGEVLAPVAWVRSRRAQASDSAKIRTGMTRSTSRPKHRKPIEEFDNDGLLLEGSVLFTGFSKRRREELERFAESAGWQVRKKVSVTLDYLVTGPNAGPTKLRDAAMNCVIILSEDDFVQMAWDIE